MGLLDWLRGKPARFPDDTTTASLAAAPTTAGQSREPRAGFAVVDVETTGLSPSAHRVLELAVVRCDLGGSVIDEWSTRFNPQGPVGATHIHGIRAEDVKGAPTFTELVPELANRLSGLAVVAHNARFDMAFLRAEFERAGWQMPWLPTVCTLEASREHLPNLARRRLPDCCAEAGIRHVGAHSALGDARGAAGLLAWYLSQEANQSRRPLANVVNEARPVVWPTGPSRRPQVPLPSTRTVGARRTYEPRPPRRRLTSLLADFPLSDALLADAPEGAASYLELLAEALEDGVLDDAEREALADVAIAYGFDGQALNRVHSMLLGALADRAVEDGRVDAAERGELADVALLLDVDASLLERNVKAAQVRRMERMTSSLRPLPEGWALGEPIRVGDAVVITGCEAHDRGALERQAVAAGVSLMSKVSGRTRLLVSDGTVSGTKAADAERLGTRVVNPDTFRTLLEHIQPPTSTPAAKVSSGRPGPPDEHVIPRAARRLTAEPSVIRAWARTNGLAVSDRGRLSAEIVEAYTTAMEDRRRVTEAVEGP